MPDGNDGTAFKVDHQCMAAAFNKSDAVNGFDLETAAYGFKNNLFAFFFALIFQSAFQRHVKPAVINRLEKIMGRLQ